MTELTSKLPGFSGAHEFTKPLGYKKIHPEEQFQKYAVSACGFTGFVWTEGRLNLYILKKGAVSKISGFEWTRPELFKEKNYIEI